MPVPSTRSSATGSTRFRGEFIFNLLLIFLGLFVIIASVRLGLGSLRDPEPGFFPLIGGLVILVSNLFVIFDKSKQQEILFKERGGMIIFISFLVIFALWIMLMPYLGYVVVTFAASLAMFKLMKVGGWVKPVLLSAGVAAFIYGLFDYWLYLDLPRGILG